ncbi:protein kinase [Uliginosibacterium sp. H3]|uniref:non-specific serine/threonine protein kinase n=1 Tax=Uliginosibacterium silvisoli TaxID=3114758 RepID=A0ABU6K5V2_9RHOO|nr:protein kinase [Uliginosibacterium sp. H3]
MPDAGNDNDKTMALSEDALPSAQPFVATPVATPVAAPLPLEAQQNTLQIGTRLGEFEILDIIGEGGFGIVYLAQDHSLQRRVALKEYMPTSLASRSANASVFVSAERYVETFEIGRRSFVNEARLLAQFDHPALVKVYRFWEANGTAYMSMPFYEGRTLRDALRERGAVPDEAWIRKILSPVVDALELIHQENCYHRDIAPDNIMLLRGDRPVLLDFGAARRVISDMTQALTVILKPGYAPVEQYAEMPGMKQGPWTDIYALAAVVYFMITGRTPPPSVGRAVQDSYRPLATEAAGRYDASFLRGIDHSLSVNAIDRPQSMAEMRDLLGLVPQSRVLAPRAAKAAVATQAAHSGNAPFVERRVKSPVVPPRADRRRPVAPAPASGPTPVPAPQAASSTAGITPAKRFAIGLVIVAAIGTTALAVRKFAFPKADDTTSSAAEAPATQDTQASTLPSATAAQSSQPVTAPEAAPIPAQATSDTPASSAASSSSESSQPVAQSSSISSVTARPPVKPAPAVRAPAVAKPARKEVEPPPAKPQRRKNTPEEEAEYMRKLNRDLDSLTK